MNISSSFSNTHAATHAKAILHDSAGMPTLELGNRPLSFFEFWPTWLFYAPVFVAVILFSLRFRGLTLPTITNPTFSGGGFIGESKSQILDLARQHLGDKVAPFICFTRTATSAATETQTVEAALHEAGLSYPIVAKPDQGCRGAGVQPVYSSSQLTRYLEQFPANAAVVLQKMVACEGEAGVFYVREPHESKGRIISLTLKYFPYVLGNGNATLRELIEIDPRASALNHIYLPRFSDRLNSIPAKDERVRLAFAGNHSKGTIFRNGNDLITPQMEAMFDHLSQKIPGFYFGRYDIRFDDFTQLQAGIEDFTILEINGSGAEVTHIWDARTSLWQAWRDVIAQYYLVYKIGAYNRNRHTNRPNVAELWSAFNLEKSQTKLYPPTH